MIFPPNGASLYLSIPWTMAQVSGTEEDNPSEPGLGRATVGDLNLRCVLSLTYLQIMPGDACLDIELGHRWTL